MRWFRFIGLIFLLTGCGENLARVPPNTTLENINELAMAPVNESGEYKGCVAEDPDTRALIYIPCSE